MDISDLMGRVVSELYSGLTGGSADLPLPTNMKINWVLPGIPLHENFFDFAIAGPYAGPSAATLDDFENLVNIIAGNAEAGGSPMDRKDVIEEAKRMYQQQLLGSWEQWSRLVDFIPVLAATEEEMSWSSSDDEGAMGHKGVVYGQAGQTLSQIYRDTLERCLVADEPLTEKQEKIIDRMKALLQITVEKEDFLTGDIVEEIVDSPAIIQYNAKKLAYENAVIDYATRLARSQSGSASDLIEWSRSGGIYKQRALQALNDWQATGNRSAIEAAQSAIAHITGGSMVQWKQNLLNSVKEIDENTQGSFGYSFFPATVLPGAFARSQGWTKYNQKNISQSSSSSTTTHSGSAAFGFSLGMYSVGGAGGKSHTDHNFKFDRDEFGIEFEYTQVEISRPAFNPNFFLSRGWKPRDTFIRDHGAVHSTGGDSPTGALVGYPTKALFVRNLTIYSKDIARFMKSQQDDIEGGGVVGIGPFVIGGKYAQSNRKTESNLEINESGITIKGIQLVAFLSAMFPATSNPNPDVEEWI